MKQIVFNDLMEEAPEEAKLSLWLGACAKYYNCTILNLMYLFVSKEKMLSLNQKHLEHDTDTDIITFSYSKGKDVLAEVYISSVQCRENAKALNESIENEILRLMAHGFLHAIGYEDKEKNEKMIMREEENRCIEMFHVKQKGYV